MRTGLRGRNPSRSKEEPHKATPGEAALTAKNYKLAKELVSVLLVVVVVVSTLIEWATM